MLVELKTRIYRPGYTISKFFINGVYYFDTLEDQNRDLNLDGDLYDPNETKVFGETCIPSGKYTLRTRFSPRFNKNMFGIENVKSFTGILIHTGNTPKDTHGCILIGQNRIKGQLINSTACYKTMCNVLGLPEKMWYLTKCPDITHTIIIHP